MSAITYDRQESKRVKQHHSQQKFPDHFNLPQSLSLSAANLSNSFTINNNTNTSDSRASSCSVTTTPSSFCTLSPEQDNTSSSNSSSGSEDTPEAENEEPDTETIFFETTLNHLNITVHCEQLNSGEDMVPQYHQERERTVFIVADGHSGRECVDALHSNKSEIFHRALRSGTKSAMQICAELCKTFRSGAMVVIGIYNQSTRRLEICSKGDASCNVYLENENDNTCTLFHEQQHHSPIELNNVQKQIEMKSKAIRCENVINPRSHKYRIAPPVPDQDGKTLHWNPNKLANSFFFPNGSCIAASSFVGHEGVAVMDANYTEIDIPLDTKFHIVATSDGVSDVMHPRDPEFLRSSSGIQEGMPVLSAQRVIEKAKEKWFNECILNYDDGRPLSSITYAPSAEYADDISCIVIRG